MRGEGRSRLTRRTRVFLAAGLVLAAGTAALAQMSAEKIIPPLTGAAPPMEELPASPTPKWTVDDIRQMLEAQNEMRSRRGAPEIDGEKLRVEVEAEQLEALRRSNPVEPS